MNHRRLRLPAAMVLIALAAPVLAADPSSDDRSSPVTNLQRDARELRDSVHQNSVEFGHQVAQSVHQARHQLTVGMHRANATIRHWWDNTRDTVARI